MKEEEVADKSLQYNIVMEKVRRGVLVTIGCERFVFHNSEMKHMAKVISEYVKDYSAVREYCEINVGSLVGEYTQDEETILDGLNYFEELCVKIGLAGYKLAFMQQGEENDMYFSNIADLSDKLYSLIVEYEHHDTLPPPLGVGAVVAETAEINIKWDPVTGGRKIV